jgi:hypothetical protein
MVANGMQHWKAVVQILPLPYLIVLPGETVYFQSGDLEMVSLGILGGADSPAMVSETFKP